MEDEHLQLLDEKLNTTDVTDVWLLVEDMSKPEGERAYKVRLSTILSADPIETAP